MSLHCLWLFEFAHTLDVIHKISAVDVLHNKVQPILDLKKRTEVIAQRATSQGEGQYAQTQTNMAIRRVMFRKLTRIHNVSEHHLEINEWPS